MNMRITVGLAAGLAALLITAGCGGTSSPTLGTASNPQARAVDADAAVATMAITIDGNTMPGVSTFGQVSGYQVFNNGNRTIVVTDASSGATLATQSPLFTLNSNYTVIAYQAASGPSIMVLSDSNHAGSAQATLRFAKAAAGTASSVDVYVTAPGASITSLNPTYAGVTLGSVNQKYVTMASGTYSVVETAAGSKVPILTQQVTLSGATATTLLDVGTSTLLSLQDQ